MKDLATIVISFLGIVVSIVFLLMSVCSFIGGVTGAGGVHVLLSPVFFAVGVGMVLEIVKRNRSHSDTRNRPA